MCEHQRTDVTPRERDLPRDLTRSLACGATRVSRRACLPLTGGAAPTRGQSLMERTWRGRRPHRLARFQVSTLSMASIRARSQWRSAWIVAVTAGSRLICCGLDCRCKSPSWTIWLRRWTIRFSVSLTS